MILRRLLTVALIGALGLAASGCGSTLSDAATITYRDAIGKHTVHITRERFRNELDELVANKKFQDLLAKSSANSDGKNSSDARVSALWLNQLIRQAVIDAEFAQQHLVVSTSDRDNAKNDVYQQFSSRDVFEAFSKIFQAQLIEREARFIAVSDGCASGKAVGHVLVASKAAAAAVMKQLAAGANFADVAKAKSKDPGSAAQGGLLGCLAPGEYVKEFQDAADAAPFERPVGPVHTQFGYHVILVRRWDPQLASNQQIATGLQQAAGAALTARLKTLHVHIDPRYGGWSCGVSPQGQPTLQVNPPSVASPRSARDAPATTATIPPTCQ
jgi:hypothetical protein